MTNIYDEYMEFRAANKLPINLSPKKRTKRGISLSDDAVEGLRHIARQYGINRGKTVNVSALIEQIGLGHYIITPRRTSRVD